LEGRRIAMLKVINLRAKYGGINALRGVNIEVNDNEIVAILGSNGAGKSTLLKCITGLMKCESDGITFDGYKVPTSPYEVVKLGISHVPEGRQIFPNLTVYENLMVGAFIRSDKSEIEKDLKHIYELFPILKEREKQYGGLLSGGEQQMLAISRGLMSKPKLLLLDEPSLGLAPIIVSQIFQIIKEINKEGTGILVVEQNAYKALQICDRAYMLDVGEIEATGTGEELLGKEDLAKHYLGQ
jgi:branched-chain amino acid transport system ATP-binding protein